jgi:hypothetical protein
LLTVLPSRCIHTLFIASAVGEDMPFDPAHLLGVDGDDDALRADLAGRFEHQIRILHRRGVHAHLVGTGIEQAADIGTLRTPTADGQRDEDLFGAGFDDVQDDVALIGRGRDIEEGDSSAPCSS